MIRFGAKNDWYPLPNTGAEIAVASFIKRTWKNGPAWYIQYYVGNHQRRIRASDNFQIAKEKLRRFNAAQAAGDELRLPTRPH